MEKTRKTVLILILSLISFAVESQQLDGKASYYSQNLHGRRMANGQRYDGSALTCAHKTLPFGTMLRVTNLSNGNEVIVEVTDRGPYAHGRVVDLSYRAARELGMLGAGVVRVKVDVLPPGATVPYRTDEDNPLELPEGYEAGLAGVCYEFIPEWEKPKETELKTVPRRTQSQAAKQASSAKAEQRHATAAKPEQKAAQQHHAAAQTQKTMPQQKAPAKKQESSKSWTSFFKEMFD